MSVVFELYQRILDDEEVMEISPPVIILDRRSNGGFEV
jgi:hypothetical protein